MQINWGDIAQEAAALLSRYIQFDTTNPPGNETAAIQFLADTLAERGFAPQILTSAPNRANLVVRLKSSTPTAQPCLLYAHADVVPADPANWSVGPFSGTIKDGFVWGRGALDDKGLGIIFLQALTLIKQHAPPLNRDIILLIAADEETCGQYGVSWLLNHHPNLINAEYVWDEGGMGLNQPPNSPLFHIAVAEKTALTLTLTATGTPGHASIPRADNPPDRLIQALHRIRQWKQPALLTDPVREMLTALAKKQTFPNSFLFAHAGNPLFWATLHPLLAKNPKFAPLITNTVNLTMLNSGQASNIIPAQAQATLDVRLLPGQNAKIFISELRSLIVGLDVTVEVEGTPPEQVMSPSNSQFYRALVDTLLEENPTGQVIPYLTPGATDSRFFRAAGMKAYGFMPMLLNSTELSRIHGIDERVSIANLQFGIRTVFETLCKIGE